MLKYMRKTYELEANIQTQCPLAQSVDLYPRTSAS